MERLEIDASKDKSTRNKPTVALGFWSSKENGHK